MHYMKNLWSGSAWFHLEGFQYLPQYISAPNNLLNRTFFPERKSVWNHKWIRVTDQLGEFLVHSPFSKQGQLGLWGLSPGGFEYLQGWRLNSASGHPVPFDHPHSENEQFFFLVLKRIFNVSVYTYFFLLCLGTTEEKSASVPCPVPRVFFCKMENPRSFNYSLYFHVIVP